MLCTSILFRNTVGYQRFVLSTPVDQKVMSVSRKRINKNWRSTQHEAERESTFSHLPVSVWGRHRTAVSGFVYSVSGMHTHCKWSMPETGIPWQPERQVMRGVQGELEFRMEWRVLGRVPVTHVVPLARTRSVRMCAVVHSCGCIVLYNVLLYSSTA